MPNVRDPKKKMVGFWLSPEELQMVDELAIRYGVTRADLVRSLVKNQHSPIGFPAAPQKPA